MISEDARVQVRRSAW